ncbi:MAG: hypothetical protein Q9181_007501, partial [Wetmoreana brouardii]
AGISYTVFERDNEHDFFHGPRDWGMLLHWGADYLAKILPPHLQTRMKEPRCDPHLNTLTGIPPVPYVDASTGDVLAEVPMQGINRVSRMKLRRFLTQGENLDIRFDKYLERVSVNGNRVSVTFRDGVTETGNIAIGCDGARSKVRELLVGHEAAQLEPVDLTMINFPKEGYTADEARLLQTLHPVFKIAACPDRQGNGILAALDIANPNDPTTWKFQNYIGWWGPPYAHDLQDPEKRMQYYRDFVSSFCDPFRTAGLKLRDGEILPVYPGQQWAPTMPWDNYGGKVTLAGDAAHSMVPQRGQGLNNAIKDASDIVDAIKAAISREMSLKEAITAYEAEMKPRGAREVALSLEQALKGRNKNTIKDGPLFKLGWQREKILTVKCLILETRFFLMETARLNLFGLLTALGAASILATVVVISYLVYNVFFHSLRKFPGPKLWAATRLPWCYYQYQGRLHHRLLQLHIQYGHTVRVAPNELSYTHEAVWKTVYGHRKEEMGKDPTFRLHTPTGAQNILVADRETHIRQRRLLAHAFSESALREQEPILQLYACKLLDQLSHNCNTGSLDMVAWLTFASFDLIGHMSFGENFGCLDKGDYVPFVRAITAMASELTFNQMWKYWGVMAIRQFFTPKELVGQRVKHIRTAMQTVQRRIEKGSQHRDFLHYILSANDEKGMSPAEINVNAFSLSIAGSESTATALAGAFFLVLTHPSVYQRLVDEVRSAHADEEAITLASTHKLEYLDAVSTETLRLYPPVAITLPRRVPAGGELIAGAFVPADMTVGVHHYSTYHHPGNFRCPSDFLPERWLPGTRDAPPFDKDKRDCMQPFSFGPRNCLGKNMARAEMRLLFAKLLFRFDWRLQPGQDGWMRQQKVQGFWQKKPLRCTLTPVKRS